MENAKWRDDLLKEIGVGAMEAPRIDLNDVHDPRRQKLIDIILESRAGR
jgi:hypothetical protein